MSANKNGSFLSIGLESITPGDPLPCDVYLFIDGHFLHYKKRGDIIDHEKYDKFLRSGMTHLFIPMDGIGEMQKWETEIIAHEREQAIEKVGKENAKVVDSVIEIRQEVTRIFTQEITTDSVVKMHNKSTEFIRNIASSKSGQDALLKLLGHSKTLAEHSINVANLSILVGINKKYNNTSILENLYLGALYHDIGKTKVPKEVLDDPTSNAYQNMQKNHPSMGRNMLIASSSLPEDVLDIVSQHHEQIDGQGYPKRLPSNRISELAKLVAITNWIDHQVSSMDPSLEIEIKHKTALKLLQDHSGKEFDAGLVQIVITLFHECYV